MADSKAKAWTEAEKLGILFQIIEKLGAIPWDDLTLPEGRTKKAVQVMVDREKTKLKKARGGDGSPDKKRAGDEEGADEEGCKAERKKVKTPRKKTAKTSVDTDAEEIVVKAEQGE